MNPSRIFILRPVATSLLMAGLVLVGLGKEFTDTLLIRTCLYIRLNLRGFEGRQTIAAVQKQLLFGSPFHNSY